VNPRNGGQGRATIEKADGNVVRAFGPFPSRNETGGRAVGAPDEPSPAIEGEHRSSGVVAIHSSRNEAFVSEALPTAESKAGSSDPGRRPQLAPLPSPAAPLATASIATDRLRVGMLSAVAGYVDAAGFVTLLGLFPAHLTGEIVGMTLAVANGGGSSLRTHLAMIPVFIASVVLGVLVARAFRRHGHTPLVPLLALMTLALMLFSATGFILPELKHSSHPVPVLIVSAVAAMGFQNTFMREAVGTTCPTTVMTGNLTQFIIELVDLFIPRLMGDHGHRSEADRKKADARLKLVSTALGGFVGGAALGGWLAGWLGPRSMLLPALAAAFLAWLTWRDSRKDAARPQ
jgi:uncharacterized membrane protein YoaK (UPF0700 family)